MTTYRSPVMTDLFDEIPKAEQKPLNLDGVPPFPLIVMPGGTTTGCVLTAIYEGRAFFDSPLIRGSWCDVHEHWFFTPLEVKRQRTYRERGYQSRG